MIYFNFYKTIYILRYMHLKTKEIPRGGGAAAGLAGDWRCTQASTHISHSQYLIFYITNSNG